MTTGVDYAWSHPDPATVAATVVHGERLSFVARYYSSDMTKALGRGETSALERVGLAIVTVWEDAAGNARLGANQGAADGARAASEAAADGQPADRPIFYAVDYDAPPQDWPAIAAYLDAAGHASGHPVGIYGGYGVCQRMNLDGHAAWIWQTAAWSGGRILSNAHIYQQVAQVTIAGVTCDVNLGLRPDFGQWGAAVAPPAPLPAIPAIAAYPEDHMQRVPLNVTLDASGNGYNDLAVPFTAVAALLPNGADPATNHAYSPIPRLSASAEGTGTRVEVEGGPAGGTVLVWVTTAA